MFNWPRDHIPLEEGLKKYAMACTWLIWGLPNTDLRQSGNEPNT